MSKHVLGIVVLGISTAVVGTPSIATAAQPCENLTSLKLPDTTITAAAVIQEGPFAPPAPNAGCWPRSILRPARAFFRAVGWLYSLTFPTSVSQSRRVQR